MEGARRPRGGRVETARSARGPSGFTEEGESLQVQDMPLQVRLAMAVYKVALDATL